MNSNDFQYDKRVNEYDRYSGLETKPNKNLSFLTLLIIGLLVLLACSLGYDNWLKPYLASQEEQVEQRIVSGPQGVDIVSVESQNNEIAEDIKVVEFPASNPAEKKRLEHTKDANFNDPASSAPSSVIPSNPVTPSNSVVPSSAQSSKTTAQTTTTTSATLPSRGEEQTSPREDYSGLSTTEILERQNHESVVRQARRAGVSTEGTTTEILERINHASVVQQAQRAGVSTEGTTTEILERINHESVVQQAQRAGVSTEGTTTEILERINHASVVKQAQRAGVSTEGTTTEILERINRKSLERMRY